jgi:hypothetical protein
MKELDSKKVFWAVLVITVILACSSGYPSGGGSLVEQLITGKIGFNGDHFGGLVSNLHLSNQSIAKGEMPWWNPYYGMGRPLFADSYHHGVFNPTQWFNALLFNGSLARQDALGIIMYTVLICIGVLFYLRTVGISPISSGMAALLFLSAAYFSQGGNFLFSSHPIYLALVVSLLFLEIQAKKGSWSLTFLLAPIMGWFLLTARADVMVYFGFVVGLHTLARIMTTEKSQWGKIIAQTAVFLIATVAVTSVQTLPLKAIGAASARTVAHHTGHGIDLLRGLKALLNYHVFGDRWGSGIHIPILRLVLVSLAFFEANHPAFNKLRLFAISCFLILFLLVSGVLDPLMLLIGFDMQPIPYMVLADVCLLGLVGAGIYIVSNGELTRRRYIAYLFSLAVVFLFCELEGKSSKILRFTGGFILLFESLHFFSNRATRASPLWWKLIGLFVCLGVLWIGNSPFHYFGHYVNFLPTTYGIRDMVLGMLKYMLLGILILWLAIGGIFKWRVSQRLSPKYSVAGAMMAVVILFMHVVPDLRSLPAPIESLKLPQQAQKYFSGQEFRTLNVCERDVDKQLPVFTGETVNYFLTFPMYAPFYPYLETSGGHSVAPIFASEFADLVNYGFLWKDPRHPRFKYLEDFKRKSRKDWILGVGSEYGQMQAMKKSVVMFNADSPFLRYSATRYAISHQDYRKSKHLELVDVLKSPVTYGRVFDPQVYKDKYYVYRVKNAVSRAYVPNKYYVLETDSDVVERLRELREPNQAVILGDEGLSASASGRITKQRWQASKLHFEIEMESKGFLVISDLYFPGWIAKVDGKPESISRANHAFRAVYLSPGHHLVEFFYRPQYFVIGLIITIVTILTSLISSLFFYLKSERRTHSNNH